MQPSQPHNQYSDGSGAQQPPAEAPAPNHNQALSSLQHSTDMASAAVSSLLNTSNNSSSNNNTIAPVQPQAIPILNPALLPFLQASLSTAAAAVPQPSLATNFVAPQVQPVAIGGIPAFSTALAPVVYLPAPTVQHNYGNAPSVNNQTSSILASLGIPQTANNTAGTVVGNSQLPTLAGADTSNSFYNVFPTMMSANAGVTAAPIGAINSNQQGLLTVAATPLDQGGVAQHQLASLRQNLLNDLGRRQAEDERAQQTGRQETTQTDGTQAAAANADTRKTPPRRLADASDAASSLMLLQQNTPTSASTNGEFPFADLVANSTLTNINLRGLVSDSFFIAIAQMKPCRLKEDDRVGKYKHRKIGFVGLCCRHCQGQPGFGRYFPSTFDSFLNGKNSDGIVQHVIECIRCPEELREIVAELERRENKHPSRQKYGSRKSFFSYIWEELRSLKAAKELDAALESSNLSENPSQEQETTVADDAAVVETHDSTNDASSSIATFENPISDDGGISWEALTSKSEIVNVEDRNLISDLLIAALAQMKPCPLTADDQVGRCKNHNIGFIGMCCRWCNGRSGKPGYGRYFPSSVRSLAQVDSCQHVVKHVAVKCAKCPETIRKLIIKLQQREEASSSQRLRYGSRIMFFRRVWSRLHGEDTAEKPVHLPMKDDSAISTHDTGEKGGDVAVKQKIVENNTDWDKLLAGSTIVSIADKGLVTPSQFGAMAQMKACRLTQADQTGWYKKRPLNFGGFCCRHCGGDGRAGFGRYFPNSRRSFAQTVSSNTLVSHITSYCKKCPEDIRTAIAELYEAEKELQNEKVQGNTTYGARKKFYDRVWARIHDATSANTFLEGAPTANHAGEQDICVSFVAGIANTEAGCIEAMASKPATAIDNVGGLFGKRPAQVRNEVSNKCQKTEDIVQGDGVVGFTTIGNSNIETI